jgi:hypothetical protein
MRLFLIILLIPFSVDTAWVARVSWELATQARFLLDSANIRLLKRSLTFLSQSAFLFCL